jgi:hypothetical protein
MKSTAIWVAACIAVFLAIALAAGAIPAQQAPQDDSAKSELKPEAKPEIKPEPSASRLAAPEALKLDGLPRVVQQSLQSAGDECKKQEGSRVVFAPDTVRKLDLNGDGRDDYIVDFRDAKCEGFEWIYCGTGGCDLEIIVSRRRGGFRRVFSEHVRDYRILPGKGARTIRFSLHGGICGGFGPDECNKLRKISDRAFKFR